MNTLVFRDLDIAVAEEIFGHVWLKVKDGEGVSYLVTQENYEWEIFKNPSYYERVDGRGENPSASGLPYYSSEQDAAWSVVEKIINEHNVSFELLYDENEDTWYAGFAEKSVPSSTAPRAICAAALAYVKKKKSDE